MRKYFLIPALVQILFVSCERVIEIDLKSSSPSIVAEARLFMDSVLNVKLTYSSDYYSATVPEIIDDAVIKFNDGAVTEELLYTGNGNYRGSLIKGKEGGKYYLEIFHSGIVYCAGSEMPASADIVSIQYSISNSQSILNPEGRRVVTVSCEFLDDPYQKNFYMICFMSDGRMIEDRYFMISENNANGGSLTRSNDLINFSESMFYEGSEVEIRLYSMDEAVYKYFYQMDDILFWKRRVIPPVPYNPVSNFSNGALGYFAAWTYDSRIINLEDL